MVKKPRRMRTFARTASKSMEKKLIQNAKKLKKDPFIVIPNYEDDHSEKYFSKIKKKIHKVSQYVENTDKLEKYSKKRGLEGAVAGTLLLAHSEKAPYLAVAKFPSGDVTYAKRGRSDKEKLIAVQHFDDPVLRILGIKDIAYKKNLKIYSWDDGFFSSGSKPNPPDEFIKFIGKKISLSHKNDSFMCSHLNSEEIKNKEDKKNNYLMIHWRSADKTIVICEKCANKDNNTFFKLSRFMFGKNISDDFEISVVGSPVEGKTDEEFNTIDVDDYLSGKLNDYDFIKNNMRNRRDNLKDSSEKIFILNKKAYGKDMDSFIKDLDPNEYEREGLNFILQKVNEPVIFDDATPNRVLDYYWKDFGLNLVENIIEDQDRAEKFYSLDDEPSDILELVFKYKERKKVLSKLPNYKSLPKLAEYADNIARTFKSFGEKKTIVELRKKPEDTKAKSLSYAFLLAFEKAQDKKWKYSDVEIEYGNFLKEYAEKLLQSSPEKYHENLKNLLTACGLTENIDSYKI